MIAVDQKSIWQIEWSHFVVYYFLQLQHQLNFHIQLAYAFFYNLNALNYILRRKYKINGVAYDCSLYDYDDELINWYAMAHKSFIQFPSIAWFFDFIPIVVLFLFLVLLFNSNLFIAFLLIENWIGYSFHYLDRSVSLYSIG